MVVEVTLVADPTEQEYRLPIEFSGRVMEDGLPLEDVTVNVWEVEGDEPLAETATGHDGSYSVEWRPDTTYEGDYEFKAAAAHLKGFWSNTVKIKVT